MKNDFWQFIEDADFSGNGFQVDLSYYMLFQKGYTFDSIKSYEKEFEEKIQELKGTGRKLKGFVVSMGEEYFNNYKSKSVNDIVVAMPFHLELTDFALIFTEIEQGECYPSICDKDNLFFSLSTTNLHNLVKMLFIPNLKEFIASEVINRGGYTKKTIKQFLKSRNFKNF